ncbi:hypothetical protein LH51_14630 [Nitrincola sp. A-D6]|uniref:pilus assembly PilX family protein n=1 Tax=Nitrincola sp. A-D6 TaxID=1545442 RepID=UPI00051FBA6E|nr:pilus assembly PilX N-terminal domain-containing protein [Nitrincola sp. A-D6]KGK41473.1 hypothetical protein LH51_14630 [Nitrincola sp. A-D6]
MTIQLKTMQGNSLLVTLIFLSVIAMLTFSAAVNSQLQQRMSHNLHLKVQSDEAADSGVMAFYTWLSADPDHWESEGWESLNSGDPSAQSYYEILADQLDWDGDYVTLTVRGAVQSDLDDVSNSLLRVSFYRSVDEGRIYLHNWAELL